MTPWKLIGTVAGGAASIAAVAGVALLLQSMAIWIKGSIERDILYQIQAETHKWEKVVAENAGKARDKERDLKDSHAIERGEMQEKIDDLFDTIELQVAENPYLADIALHRNFYRIMCKIENIGDNEARRACDIHSREAPTPNSTPFVSISRKTIDDWQQLCAATGDDIYCNPVVIGLRNQSTRELANWMIEVDSALTGYERNISLLTEQLELAKVAAQSTVEER